MTLFMYICLYSLLLGFIIFYPLYHEMNLATDAYTQLKISTIVLYLHKRVWVGLFLVAVLASLHAIVSSYRLVGPVYRFEKTLEELLRGNYGLRIRIRKGDEFKEMEALLNRLAGKLEQSRARSEHSAADMKTRLETAAAMLEAGHDGSVETVSRQIRSVLKALDEQGDGLRD